MSSIGPTINPVEKWCWSFCPSCNRCQDKGRYTRCNGCSGRYGKTKQGKLILTRFKSNPFKGQVRYEKKTEDERDWDSYVNDMREKLDDPNWNPVTIYEE